MEAVWPLLLVIGVVMAPRHPILPRIGVAMHVHDRDHQQRVIDDTVDHAIGKAAQSATPRPLRQERPCLGEFGDAVQCLLHLDRQLVSESFALLVLIGHRILQLDRGRPEKFDRHLLGGR